jgi:hypothetical protein
VNTPASAAAASARKRVAEHQHQHLFTVAPPLRWGLYKSKSSRDP